MVSLSFSPNGKFLASTGKDRRLCIWKKNGTNAEIKFDLSVIVESSHKRIVWSVDFCQVDSTVLATGSRDGLVKIWKVAEEPSGDDGEVVVKELLHFEPVCKGDKKVEPITAIAFAPKNILIECNGEQVDHAILAIGMECGLIEIWAVPLDTKGGECIATFLYSIPVQDCHIGVVKKLAWRPLQKNESDMTLASCSTDHGVRIYNVRLNA